MAHECHFDKEGKNPTNDDCRACEFYEDTGVYSEDVSAKFWDILTGYLADNEGKDGIEKVMQSDQISHLFCTVSTRSHLLSGQMQLFVQMFGQRVDLIPTMQTAFAFGYIFAKLGEPKVPTYNLLNEIKEQEGTIGAVEKFLKGFRQTDEEWVDEWLKEIEEGKDEGTGDKPTA